MCFSASPDSRRGCRDLHISNPGVAWDDIAGLDDAKRVLQENVILPLLMPDYFQGIRRPVKVGCLSVWTSSPPQPGLLRVLVSLLQGTAGREAVQHVACGPFCTDIHMTVAQLTGVQDWQVQQSCDGSVHRHVGRWITVPHRDCPCHVQVQA